MKITEKERELIAAQEKEDWEITIRVLDAIYGESLTNITNRNEEEYGVSDILYTASTKNQICRYSLEVKTTTWPEEKLEYGFIFKYSKWIKMQEDRDKRDRSERLLVVFHCKQSGKSYFYDLDKVNHQSTIKAVKKLKAVQMSEKGVYQEFPVFYLPIKDAMFVYDANDKKTQVQ